MEFDTEDQVLSYFLIFFWVSLENFLDFFLFLLILQPNFLIKRFLIKKNVYLHSIFKLESSVIPFILRWFSDGVIGVPCYRHLARLDTMQVVILLSNKFFHFIHNEIYQFFTIKKKLNSGKESCVKKTYYLKRIIDYIFVNFKHKIVQSGDFILIFLLVYQLSHS